MLVDSTTRGGNSPGLRYTEPTWTPRAYVAGWPRRNQSACQISARVAAGPRHKPRGRLPPVRATARPRPGCPNSIKFPPFANSSSIRAPPMTKFATIETNKGTMRAELYEKEAPKTVANFEKLANSGFYDGTKFHRVIKDFVVQGGDPYSKGGEQAKGPVGTGGPGYKIDCETKGNPHTHQVGALSMAHAGKNTGGSQFFIVLNEQNTKHLNGVHTVFGKVIEGLDVVKTIKQNDTMTKVRVSDSQRATE